MTDLHDAVRLEAFESWMRIAEAMNRMDEISKYQKGETKRAFGVASRLIVDRLTWTIWLSVRLPSFLGEAVSTFTRSIWLSSQQIDKRDFAIFVYKDASALDSCFRRDDRQSACRMGSCPRQKHSRTGHAQE